MNITTIREPFVYIVEMWVGFFIVSALLVYLYHEDKGAIVASHKENMSFTKTTLGALSHTTLLPLSSLSTGGHKSSQSASAVAIQIHVQCFQILTDTSKINTDKNAMLITTPSLTLLQSQGQLYRRGRIVVGQTVVSLAEWWIRL